MLRLEQAELAKRAGVSAQTILRLERMDGTVSANSRTLSAIMAVLEEAGVVFIPAADGRGPGVRLARPV